jgi:peptidoglycan/LPS O-acetylase OafA/YrhL
MGRQRLHELDGLRVVACLMVLAFHFLFRGQDAHWVLDPVSPALAEWTRYGYLGVELFFMISGFVILMSARGRGAWQFVVHRAARLFPALWICACLTSGLAWYVGSAEFGVTPRQFLLNLTLLPQWFGVEFVDGAYWSLAVEVQFYLMVTLGLATGGLSNLSVVITGWLLLSTVNLLRPIYLLEQFLVVQWAPFFVAGALCYLIRADGVRARWMALLVWTYGLALLYATDPHVLQWLPLQGRPRDPLIVALLVTLFFQVLLMVSLGLWTARASRLGAWAGALTYPVYLLHQNVGYLLLRQWREDIPAFSVRLLLLFAVVVCAAHLIREHVERPLGAWLVRLERWRPARVTAGYRASPERGMLRG